MDGIWFGESSDTNTIKMRGESVVVEYITQLRLIRLLLRSHTQGLSYMENGKKEERECVTPDVSHQGLDQFVHRT